MTVITITRKDATIKEIRRTMRGLESYSQTILVEGWGQITKTGKTYAIGPVPEMDDSDPMTDYSAWNYGLKESWVLDYIKSALNLAS